MMNMDKALKAMGFELNTTNETNVYLQQEVTSATITDNSGYNTITIVYGIRHGELNARITRINGTTKWYYGKTEGQLLAIIRQCMIGYDFSNAVAVANAQQDIEDAIKFGMIADEDKEEETMTRDEAIEAINARQNAENLFYCITEADIEAEMKKEETTMKPNQFTFEGHTYYTNEKGNYFYCTKPGKAKADRIPKEIYEEAKGYYEQEKAQAELDKDPCWVDPMADLQKPAVLNEYGCVDCSECHVKPCVHRDCMRRNPRSEGGLAECPRLKVKVEEEEKPTEAEKVAEEQHIEVSDAELLINAKKTTRKPRRSKDIAYEGHGVTLTAKQVDFIHHLPDTCFWEHGLDSCIWVDCLCDDIGGQFAGKPMTVGAMISTLCEKGLGERTVDKITDMSTGRSHKAVSFQLTDTGKQVAKELGLE